MKLGNPYNTNDLKSRATGIAVFFTIFLSLLAVRLWYLQIWRGEEYRLFSDQNRFKIQRRAAPRGKVLDRHGHLLADNRPRFDLLYTRGYASDLDKEFQILSDVFSWSSDELAKKKAQILESAPYLPRMIARDLSWTELAQVESQRLELSGTDIEVRAVRDYLYGDSFFHVLGYTGEVNDSDLQRLKKRYPQRNYRLGDQIGVIGVESFYESFLRGKDGNEFVVVDVKGRPVQRTGLSLFDQTNIEKAVAGNTLQLSLDLELQLAGVRAFEDRIGAAVAMDPQTGEILAMVSRPGLDPNRFTQQVSGSQLLAWRNRPDKPFLDRSLQEHYPPGSTMKLVMALAGLEQDVIEADTIVNCPGSFRLGRRVWHDHNRAGFGKIKIQEAIKRSSNVFFFKLGLSLGLDQMGRWSRRLGLGRRTYLGNEVFANEDLVDRLKVFNQEVPGKIPSSAWVRETGHTTVKAETVNAAIGQGGFLTTITQLSRMLSALGNGGKVFQPLLVKAIREPDGEVVRQFSASVENHIEFDPEAIENVLSGMARAVNEQRGTAPRARLRNFIVGGKTGTSQVIGLGRFDEETEDKFKDHGLFVGMAPMDNPRIAVAVIVENGGSGGRSAAPIARVMMKNYLNRILGKKADLGRR